MNKNSHLTRDLAFAFTDFLALLRKYKKTVMAFMLLGSLACFLLAVTRPVVFLVQATFRDKGKTQASIRSSFSDLLFSSGVSSDSEAVSTMKSRLIIGEVIKKLNLQGYVGETGVKFPKLKNELENAGNNLFAEWAQLNEYSVPILPELSPYLVLENMFYEGEIATFKQLTFADETHFSVLDQGKEVAVGELGQLIDLKDVRFKVQNPSKTPMQKGDTYVAVLLPLIDVAKAYTGQILIDADKEDKSLLKLQFKHRDRFLAANFLNTLMDTYQSFLLDDHEMTSNSQVNYLEKRQNEVGAALEALMESHIQKTSQDMSQTGFTSLQREMDFLAGNLTNNKQKLTELILETKRLESINVEECVYYDSYSGRGDPAIINQLLNEIRSYKQQRDSLEYAIQTSRTSNPEKTIFSLEKNFKALQTTQACLKETAQLIKTLNGERKEPLILRALSSNDFPVASWFTTYKSKERAITLASAEDKPSFQQDHEQFKLHFLNYLEVFERMLNIQLATLEQQLRTEQEGVQELEGLSLDSARQLHLAYVRELNELQASEKQHRFIVDQLSFPEFELSSLTALLNDPISHERISKATQILITLKDENHHTQKEKERLTDELGLQKSFLSSHTLQMADLLALKQNVVRVKIAALQAIILNLTHQQISLLKKHLEDYVSARLENYAHEKTLLEGHQKTLHERMSEIPSKWASEQLLNHNLSMQQRFLENLATMVESKNITKNLETIQSSSLDKAVAPLNPKPPRLLFYTLFGSILGFLGASTFLFTRTMIRGIPASKENLRLSHFHVSGEITPFQGDEKAATPPLLDRDLDTLRRLIAHYEKSSPIVTQARKLLIIEGDGPDFSNTLAKLLAKKGQKPLKIQLNFKQPTDEPNSGLLQYLEGKIGSPTIEKFDGFDRIGPGGVSRYSEELLRSPRFVSLLDDVSHLYDWIIAVTPVKIPCAEAENLAKLFDGTVLVVTNETLPDIFAFVSTLDDSKKEALTFVMAREK